MNKSISTLLSARRKLISRDKEKDDHRRTVLKGGLGYNTERRSLTGQRRSRDILASSYVQLSRNRLTLSSNVGCQRYSSQIDSFQVQVLRLRRKAVSQCYTRPSTVRADQEREAKLSLK